MRLVSLARLFGSLRPGGPSGVRSDSVPNVVKKDRFKVSLFSAPQRVLIHSCILLVVSNFSVFFSHLDDNRCAFVVFHPFLLLNCNDHGYVDGMALSKDHEIRLLLTGGGSELPQKPSIVAGPQGRRVCHLPHD